jgi:hypothetical protein
MATMTSEVTTVTPETQNDPATGIETGTANETVATGTETENENESVSAKEIVIETATENVIETENGKREKGNEKQGRRKSMPDVSQRMSFAVQRKVDDILDTRRVLVSLWADEAPQTAHTLRTDILHIHHHP